MSRTIAIYGIKPADEEYKRMLCAYEACELAGVSVPDEVWEFFDHTKPNGIGVECDIDVIESMGNGCVYRDVNLDRLPKGVKVIRVYES